MNFLTSVRARACVASVFAALTVTAAASQERKPPEGDCRLEKADHTVHGVTLGSYDSGKKVLGDRMKRERQWRAIDRKHGSFPWYVFATKDGKQTAAFRVHPGDVVNSYQEIEVRYRRIGQKQLVTDEESYYIGREGTPDRLATDAFATNNGITLGMPKADVTSRLGPCFKVFKQRGAMETVRYAVFDYNVGVPILKLGNMPSYYADYQFEGGKLVRFRIGYPYP